LQLGGVGYRTTQFAEHLRNLHKHKFGVLKAKVGEDKEPEISLAVATQYTYLLLRLKSKRKQKYSQDLLHNKQSPRSIKHLLAMYEDGSRYTMCRETKDL
jgi:hypothetical protein